jgi:acetyltransferase-like isoleucine patch superfamily enzyme
MPIQIVGDVNHNEIDINPIFAAETPGIIILNGSGSRVSIATDRPSRHLRVDVDDNSSFDMGDRSYIADLHVHLRGGARASVGADTFAIDSLRLYCHEHSSLRIGDGCLIGAGALCMTSDMHSIIDTKSRQRINPPGDILIGNRVWIGAEVVILKGTMIGDGAIVGIRSVVMGDFPSDCLILGYPARLVRSDVTWAQDLTPLP